MRTPEWPFAETPVLLFWKPELPSPELKKPELPLPEWPKPEFGHRAPALLISRLVSWGIEG
nr:hypothetical protein [Mycobacterium marinum]